MSTLRHPFSGRYTQLYQWSTSRVDNKCQYALILDWRNVTVSLAYITMISLWSCCTSIPWYNNWSWLSKWQNHSIHTIWAVQLFQIRVDKKTRLSLRYHILLTIDLCTFAVLLLAGSYCNRAYVLQLNLMSAWPIQESSEKMWYLLKNAWFLKILHYKPTGSLFWLCVIPVCYSSFNPGHFPCNNYCNLVFEECLWVFFIQVKKVEDETDQIAIEFGKNLGQNRDVAEKFIGDVEMALTLLDDALIAGYYLRDKTHDTEVLERFHTVTAEINNRLTDNTVEQTQEIQPVSLCIGR